MIERRHLPVGEVAGRGHLEARPGWTPAAGVAINPGPEWSADAAYGKSRLRLCFAHPSQETLRQGVAALAEVCRREFGVPTQAPTWSAGQ